MKMVMVKTACVGVLEVLVKASGDKASVEICQNTGICMLFIKTVKI